MFNERVNPVDRFFLSIVITLLSVGLLIFVSASFGVLAKDPSKFYQILISQLVFGLLFGGIAMYFLSRVPYDNLKKYSFHIFFFSVASLVLVFIPGLGFSHGGARRWVDLGFVSFQPVELFKIGFIFYFSAWVAWVKSSHGRMKKGLIPLCGLTAIGVGLLVLQPDTKNLILLVIASAGILLIAGLPWKYVGIILGGALLGFVILITQKPYLIERVQTFIDPSHDPRGSSWQLQQSLIAVGSGGLMGRGFGQSIQKFSYLPEPQGDSIFAVAGEEFGFIGTIVIILLYVAFALRGLWIARRAKDDFGRLLVSGLVILIVAQSFLNIASTIGLFPLTGVPLVFMSQGGTSLLFAMASVGIILNVSRGIKHS